MCAQEAHVNLKGDFITVNGCSCLSSDYPPKILDVPRQAGEHRQMLPTPRQIRAARGLLGWSQADLSSKSGVSRNALYRLEGGVAEAKASTLRNLRDTLIAAGVEFLAPQDGYGEGVRMSEPD